MENREIKFYIGTTNQYKIREIASILRPLEIKLDVTDPIDPEETGTTFDDNAMIKALAYSEHVRNSVCDDLSKDGLSESDIDGFINASRIWTICEDSGIIIPALNGLPGHFAARFSDCIIENNKVIGHNDSGRDRDEIDLANNLLVLEMMKDVAQPYRVAQFVICLMVADLNGNVIFKSESSVTGWISTEMRGSDGFGYDPIFMSDKTFGKTYAEIDAMRKNLISHRRKALHEFTTWLANQIK